MDRSCPRSVRLRGGGHPDDHRLLAAQYSRRNDGGADPAWRWLSQLGIQPRGPSGGQLLERRWSRTLRPHAADWHITPDRIGILGFSAGGHLAATASTRFDRGNPQASDPVERPGNRPDFAILGYPVISMTESWTHQGSKTNLLGDQPSAELARSLSADLAVTARTPPTFLFLTNADTVVPAENSVSYYLALRKAGVPAEMHIFENGPHGVGLAQDDAALSEWPKLLLAWLRGRGLGH